MVLIRTSQGLGSGVVFDDKGDIVTNNHVVEGANRFQVVLADGRQLRARLDALTERLRLSAAVRLWTLAPYGLYDHGGATCPALAFEASNGAA